METWRTKCKASIYLPHYSVPSWTN